MTDAAHNQHSDTAAQAIATAPGPAVPARPSRSVCAKMMSVSVARIQKNRCRTTITERMVETRAELPFIGDRSVCLEERNQATRSGPRLRSRNGFLPQSVGHYARVAFWENAKPRLDRLANRLDPKALRMAIHHRSSPICMDVGRFRSL